MILSVAISAICGKIIDPNIPPESSWKFCFSSGPKNLREMYYSLFNDLTGFAMAAFTD